MFSERALASQKVTHETIVVHGVNHSWYATHYLAVIALFGGG